METVLKQLALCTLRDATMPFAFDGTVPLPVALKPPPLVLQVMNPPFSLTPFTVQFHEPSAEPSIENGAFPLQEILKEKEGCAAAKGTAYRAALRMKTRAMRILFNLTAPSSIPLLLPRLLQR